MPSKYAIVLVLLDVFLSIPSFFFFFPFFPSGRVSGRQGGCSIVVWSELNLVSPDYFIFLLSGSPTYLPLTEPSGSLHLNTFNCSVSF